MRTHQKIFVFFILLIGAGIAVAGCGAAKTVSVQRDENLFMAVTDDLGRTAEIEQKPARIVALSPSFLAPLGAVEASVVGRPSSKTGVPDFAKPIEEVGAVYNINIEKVIALNPDLVIAYQGMHDKFVPLLESNRIPVIVVRLKTYQDVKDKIQLFAKLCDHAEKGYALVADMEARIQKTIDRTPKEGLKVAILHSTAKSVTVELDGSIAGSAAKMLGFVNVASGKKALDKDPDSAPYSLETLVESNPDIIFVATMGQLEEIKNRMLEDMESNPAWNSVEAVKNRRIYFLPQELFLLNPGLRYPEAVETMAKMAYPEVFADGK